MTRYSVGICTSLPTPTILPSRMSTTPPSIGSPAIVRTLPPLIATAFCAGAGEEFAIHAARTASAPNMRCFIVDQPFGVLLDLASVDSLVLASPPATGPRRPGGTKIGAGDPLPLTTVSL